MAKRFFSAAVFILLALAVHAQSAEKITELIKADQVSYAQLCYLSATAKGLVDDTVSYHEAYKVLCDEGTAYAQADAEVPVTLKTVASMCAKTWKVKGGICYTLFHTPRYAFRQMKADGVIPSSADPDKTANGRDVLNIISACITTYDRR